MNLREGKGILKSSNITIEGFFLQNKPHGECKITSLEMTYIGSMHLGKKQGKGIFDSKELNYEGDWHNDLK